jgi:hypothetical protein
MRTREDSILYVLRQHLIEDLLDALVDVPYVFLPANEAENLWADRRSFHHWLADAGLKVCSTIVPGGSESVLYKISKDLPLAEVMNGTDRGRRWMSRKNIELPSTNQPRA